MRMNSKRHERYISSDYSEESQSNFCDFNQNKHQRKRKGKRREYLYSTSPVSRKNDLSFLMSSFFCLNSQESEECTDSDGDTSSTGGSSMNKFKRCGNKTYIHGCRERRKRRDRNKQELNEWLTQSDSQSPQSKRKNMFAPKNRKKSKWHRVQSRGRSLTKYNRNNDQKYKRKCDENICEVSMLSDTREEYEDLSESVCSNFERETKSKPFHIKSNMKHKHGKERKHAQNRRRYFSKGSSIHHDDERDDNECRMRPRTKNYTSSSSYDEERQFYDHRRGRKQHIRNDERRERRKSCTSRSATFCDYDGSSIGSSEQSSFHREELPQQYTPTSSDEEKRQYYDRWQREHTKSKRRNNRPKNRISRRNTFSGYDDKCEYHGMDNQRGTQKRMAV